MPALLVEDVEERVEDLEVEGRRQQPPARLPTGSWRSRPLVGFFVLFCFRVIGPQQNRKAVGPTFMDVYTHALLACFFMQHVCNISLCLRNICMGTFLVINLPLIHLFCRFHIECKRYCFVFLSQFESSYLRLMHFSPFEKEGRAGLSIELNLAVGPTFVDVYTYALMVFFFM